MPEYIIRTLIRVEADGPVEGAERYKDFLAANDLDELVYRVEDVDTNTMSYVFRQESYTLEELQEYLDRLGAEDEGD